LLNFISTILKPVPSVPENLEKPPQQGKCVSRKGKKIEKRILIDEDYDEDEDGALVGETSFAEFPWMVEILKKNRKTNSFEYKCGGVLISSTTALTANHCLKGSNNKPSNYLVRAGEWDRSNQLEFSPHQDRAVSQIIAHPEYYSGGLFNDIAIIKWQTPLENEVNIAPICLPDESDVFEAGKYCTITGWGKTDENSATTDILKFVKVPIVNRDTCERQFQQNRLGPRFRLHESFVCAGGEEGKDSCSNDGGSPLVCSRSDGSYVLAGLVSWGLDCGQKNVPGAYTNIQNLLKWIKSH
jgi:secreted trypsin-like serine protease